MNIKGINFIVKKFKQGNVLVTGLRGTGKDLLFGNVINRRRKPYISNLNYGGSHIPFNYKDIDLGGNTYDSMLNSPAPYTFPYPLGTDVYISDVGVYFPAQYCNELNKKYQSIPYYMALSRQVSRNNVFCNCQNINRIWDKLREQSDIYITAKKCLYIPYINLVFQRVIIYDKYESCVDRVMPCRIKYPKWWDISDKALQKTMYVDSFENNHGSVKEYLLIYFNRSHHDTYYFEKLLKGENTMILPKNEKKLKDRIISYLFDESTPVGKLFKELTTDIKELRDNKTAVIYEADEDEDKYNE